MHIVIVGNGVAGMEAALLLRSRDAGLTLTIVSEESDHFFSRTALVWVLCGQMSYRDIEPYERDVYSRAQLQRVRARALRVDTQAKRLHLAGEPSRLEYDRLLIACGSRPRAAPWPNASLAGIGHFVTLQDLQWLEQELHGGPAHNWARRPDAHAGASPSDSPYRSRAAAASTRGRLATRPAIIGGGLVGIEVVEACLAARLRPSFFMREEWFWPIALDPREARWIMQRMVELGVEVRAGEEVRGFAGDELGTVQAVETSWGTHPVDLVVVAIGVRPNTGWLRTSGIELDADGGIVVDDRLRTSVSDVFAAGDCASVRWFDGSQRPEQLWYTARDQGRVAARALLGESAHYERGTWYNSAKLMDIEYTSVGAVNMRLEEERDWFHEETGRVRSTTRIVTQQERVVGFNLLGRRWDHSVLARWIEQRRRLPWVLEHLHHASFDSEFVPPLRLS